MPSELVRATLLRAAPRVDAGTIVVCASKGLEPDSGETMIEVLRAGLPEGRAVVLSGPTFAQEVAAGLPAALVAASADVAAAGVVQAALGGERLRIYTSDDAIGVCVGGALKNVVAIAAGCCDGFGLGASARAALITRGLAEMGRLADRKGGQPLTLAGLAGLGDLVLTCTGDLSRNRQVGPGARARRIDGRDRRQPGARRRGGRDRAHRPRPGGASRRRHADHPGGGGRPLRWQAGAGGVDRSARPRRPARARLSVAATSFRTSSSRRS